MEHPFRIIIWNLPDREHPANALAVQVQVHAPFLRQELIYHMTVPLWVHCLALHMHFFSYTTRTIQTVLNEACYLQIHYTFPRDLADSTPNPIKTENLRSRRHLNV